jgi:ankyrin repeat protein
MTAPVAVADWFMEPLVNAVVCGDEVAVTRLLSLGGALTVQCADHRGLTALHWAASSPESELLVPLLLGKCLCDACL